MANDRKTVSREEQDATWREQSTAYYAALGRMVVEAAHVEQSLGSHVWSLCVPIESTIHPVTPNDPRHAEGERQAQALIKDPRATFKTLRKALVRALNRQAPAFPPPWRAQIDTVLDELAGLFELRAAFAHRIMMARHGDTGEALIYARTIKGPYFGPPDVVEMEQAARRLLVLSGHLRLLLSAPRFRASEGRPAGDPPPIPSDP